MANIKNIEMKAEQVAQVHEKLQKAQMCIRDREDIDKLVAFMING